MRTDRDRLMKTVRDTDFAILDVGMYLNSHPKDEKAMDYFNRYQQINKEATREYEKHFGPLTVTGVDTNNGWTWTKGPWPWEGGCD